MTFFSAQGGWLLMGGLPETAGGVLGGPDKKQFGNQGPEAQPRRPPASMRLCHARAERPMNGPSLCQHHLQSPVRAVPRSLAPPDSQEHCSHCAHEACKGSGGSAPSLSRNSKTKGQRPVPTGASPVSESVGPRPGPPSAALPKLSSHTQLRAQVCLSLALRG